jgi:hypothetical protein
MTYVVQWLAGQARSFAVANVDTNCSVKDYINRLVLMQEMCMKHFLPMCIVSLITASFSK